MFRLIKSRYCEILLGFMIIGYVYLFSYLSIHRMLSLNSHYYDLGIMNQVVYNTSRGNILEMTNQEFLKNISRFAIHFDAILILFAPFYWIWPRPEVLLIVQTVILALGGLAVYLIANKLLKNKLLALLFNVSYLLYYPVQRANLFDFHPVVLATSFFLWAYYFYLEKRNWLFWSFIFLALLTKEHVGLVVFLLGFYLVIFKKEKQLGLQVCVVGLIFFIVTFMVIIPHFRQETHFAVKYLVDFGDTPSNALIGIIKNPKLVIKDITAADRQNYLKQLLYPFSSLLIFSPIEFLISLPELFINLLSSNNNMRDIYFHYNSLIVPFTLLAGIYGFSRIKKYRWSLLILILFIYMNYVSAYRLDSLPTKLVKDSYIIKALDDKKLAVIYRWQKQLDDDRIKVATTPKLAPFFTSRHFYYNFLYDPAFSTVKISQQEILTRINKYEMADYVIINKEEISASIQKELTDLFYNHLVKNQIFQKIFDEEGIEVYKKLESL